MNGKRRKMRRFKYYFSFFLIFILAFQVMTIETKAYIPQRNSVLQKPENQSQLEISKASLITPMQAAQTPVPSSRMAEQVTPFGQEWMISYGLNGNVIFLDGIATSDLGYLAIGYTESDQTEPLSGSPIGSTDLMDSSVGIVVKFNGFGEVEWSQKLKDGYKGRFTSGIECFDSNFLITGYYEPLNEEKNSLKNQQGQNAFLLKLDNKGNKVWETQFGGSGRDRFYSVLQTAAGDFLAVGESNSSNSGDVSSTARGNGDALIVKFNSTGNPLWHKLIGGTNRDYAKSAIELEGSYFVVGGTYSSLSGDIKQSNSGSQDALIFKVSSSGTIEWSQIFGGRSFDELSSLTSTSDGDLIAVGSSFSTRNDQMNDVNQGERDALIVKFNSKGTLAWNHLIGSRGSDQFHQVQASKDGNFLAVGRLSPIQTGGQASSNSLSRGYLYKFNDKGDFLWEASLGEAGLSEIMNVVELDTGSYLAVGYRQSLQDGKPAKDHALVGFMAKYQVPAKPIITTQSSYRSILKGLPASFEAVAMGNPTPSIQWQVRMENSKIWQDIYGETKTELNFFPNISDHGNAYRAVFTNSWGSAVSDEALLMLNEKDVLERIMGSSRIRTAVAVSQANYKTTDIAILTDASNFPDALAASSLSYQLRAPILLTDSAKLNEISKAELSRLKVKKVIILGGSKAVDNQIEEDLKKELKVRVQRISGRNRYETATKIAELLEKPDQPIQEIILASGEKFADALSSGSYAAKDNKPILLSNSNKVPPALQEYISTKGVKKVRLIGGEEAISKDVEDKIKAQGVQVERIAGSNRTITSVKIAAIHWPKAETAIIANGLNFPDALAAAPYAAKLGAPILLVQNNRLNPQLSEYLKTSNIKQVFIIGGDAAVGEEIKEDIRKILTGK